MSKYLNRIEEAEERGREFEARIADPELAKQPGQYQKVARGLGALRPLLEAGARYREVLNALEDSRFMLDDPDEELVELAREGDDGTRGPTRRTGIRVGGLADAPGPQRRQECIGRN